MRYFSDPSVGLFAVSIPFTQEHEFSNKEVNLFLANLDRGNIPKLYGGGGVASWELPDSEEISRQLVGLVIIYGRGWAGEYSAKTDLGKTVLVNSLRVDPQGKAYGKTSTFAKDQPGDEIGGMTWVAEPVQGVSLLDITCTGDSQIGDVDAGQPGDLSSGWRRSSPSNLP